MSDFFDKQDFFNSHASAEETITKYPLYSDWHADCTIDWLADSSRITPGVACDSWASHENALGLSGVYAPESVWSAGRLTCPAATRILNRTDTQTFSTSFHPQPSPPDSVLHFWQPSPSHHSSVRGKVAFDRVGETLCPHSIHTIPLPASPPALESTARSPSKRVSASRPLAPSVLSPSRYAPYPFGSDSDSPRRGDLSLSASLYQCRWFDGARLCGTALTGTKSAIAQHLQAAHGIRLKGDKTTQACLWDGCQKTMRGESIARHILAVHIQDKVPCPGCGSRFARVDSMQRHQRPCLARREDASAIHECKVEEWPGLT